MQHPGLQLYLMNIHNLIFSGKIKYKVLRHFLFCFSILLYSLLRIGIMYPVDHFWSYFASYFSFTLVWDSFILGFSYITVYLFVPKYLYKKKYVSFCLAVVGTYIIMYFINALQSYYQLNKTFNLMAGVQAHSFFQASNLVR